MTDFEAARDDPTAVPPSAEAAARAASAGRATTHSVTDYSKFDKVEVREDAVFEKVTHDARELNLGPIKVTLHLASDETKRGRFTLGEAWCRKTVGDLARVFYRKHAKKRVGDGEKLVAARLSLARGSYVATRTTLSLLATIGDALGEGDVVAVGTEAERAPRSPPAPGPDADAFAPFFIEARLPEERSRDGAFFASLEGELVGPSGAASPVYFEPNDDLETPFACVGARPSEAGPHVLTLRAGDEVILRETRAVDAPAPKAEPWASLSLAARGRLLAWLEACDASCSVDRSDSVSLPLPPAKDAEAPRGAARASGRVEWVADWLPAARRAALVDLAKRRGLYGPPDCASRFATHDCPGDAARHSAACPLRYEDAPDVVAAALALFPDCAPDRVELQVVHYPETGFMRARSDVVGRGPDGAWARRAAVHVVLVAPGAGGRLVFPRLRPGDFGGTGVAGAGVSGAKKRDGAPAAGASLAPRAGDALVLASADAFGRVDERMDWGVERVDDGDAWHLRVFVHSPLSVQRCDGRLCLVPSSVEPRVRHALRARVADVQDLPPEAYAVFDPSSSMPPLAEPPVVFLRIFANLVPPDVAPKVAFRLKQSEYRRGAGKAVRRIYTVEMVAPKPILATLEAPMHDRSQRCGVPLITTVGDPEAPGGYFTL